MSVTTDTRYFTTQGKTVHVRKFVFKFEGETLSHFQKIGIFGGKKVQGVSLTPMEACLLIVYPRGK